MKRIILDKGYVIDIEDSGRNLALKSNITQDIDKDGKPFESYRLHGYYGDFEKIIKQYHKLRNVDKINGEISLSELRQIFLETQKEIKHLCKQIQL